MMKGVLTRYSKQIAVDYFIVNNIITILTAKKTYAIKLDETTTHQQHQADGDIFVDDAQQISLRVESEAQLEQDTREWIEVPYYPQGINIYQ